MKALSLLLCVVLLVTAAIVTASAKTENQSTMVVPMGLYTTVAPETVPATTPTPVFTTVAPETAPATTPEPVYTTAAPETAPETTPERDITTACALETTKRKKSNRKKNRDDSGCDLTVSLTPIVLLLGAAVVIGKKKED